MKKIILIIGAVITFASVLPQTALASDNTAFQSKIYSLIDASTVCTLEYISVFRNVSIKCDSIEGGMGTVVQPRDISMTAMMANMIKHGFNLINCNDHSDDDNNSNTVCYFAKNKK